MSGPGLGEAELNTSSLVLIVPPPSSSSAPRTKVYSVASLRSPRLVLTLLRSVQYSTVQYSTVQYSAAAGAHAAQVSPRARVPGEWRHSSDYNVLKALRLENNLALLKRVLQNQYIRITIV